MIFSCFSNSKKQWDQIKKLKLNSNQKSFIISQMSLENENKKNK